MAARVCDSNQDARANECAQTLLELATSMFCAPAPPMPSPPNNNAGSYNRSPESSTPHNALKRPARTRLNSSTSPKRKRTTQLLSPTISPPQNFKPNCVMKRKGASRGQMYNELMTSIKLDHSYASGAPKNDPDSVAVSAADENVQHTVTRPSVSLLSNSRGEKHHPQPDLFKSDDANYENFNLLLKCLTNVEEPYAEKKQSNGKGKSAQSKRDGNANDLSPGSDDVMKGESPFKCKDCPKSFSKKRYLIKHVQRMHPSNSQTGNVLCRHCEQYIPHTDFPSHSCPPQELANCSFCGLRLRSNVLERHLAQEHGMERGMGSDDAGSSTISGSEHGNAEMTCVLCHKSVPASALEQHMYDEHAESPNSGTSARNCSYCRAAFPDSAALLQHMRSSHNPAASSPPHDSSSSRRGSEIRCKHSMLPRFLHDSSGGGGMLDGGEQCAQCVGSLVTSMSSASSSPSCSLSASNLLERTTTELIEAALQYAGK